MKSLNNQYLITDCCAALDVSRSGYHAWRQRKPSPRAEANHALMGQIEVVFTRQRACYGSPRIPRELRRQGHVCGRNRVAQLMREQGLNAAPNRLVGVARTTQPNQVWLSDIIYVRTDEGWLCGGHFGCPQPTHGWLVHE